MPHLDLKTLFPSLRIIDRNVFEEYIDAEQWGLSIGERAPLDMKIFLEKLEKISALDIEGDAGITVLMLPNITPREDFTLNKFIKIGKSLEKPEAMLFSNISLDVKNRIGDIPIETNTTIMLTNNVITKSRNTTFIKQDERIKDDGFEMPDIANLLIITVFTYLMDKVRLFPRDPLTYTRCSNTFDINGRLSHAAMGSFGSNGLIVLNNYANPFARGYSGVAAMLKF